MGKEYDLPEDWLNDGSKDMEDSLFLMNILKIQEEKSLFEIIEKYIHPNQQSMASKYFTKEAFSIYQSGIRTVKQ